MNYFLFPVTKLFTRLRSELLSRHEGSRKLFCLFSEATGFPLGPTQHAVGTVEMKGLGLEAKLSPPSNAGTVLV